MADTVKWFVRIAPGIVVVAIATAVAVGVVVQKSQLDPGGEFAVDGIQHPLTIHFDAQLRPYAQARTLPDALFAEGWLHSRYRLWQMELLRRAGSGRLAEGLGTSMLDTDKSLWTAGVPQLAERLERHASDRVLRLVDAYVAGINAGLDTYSVRPPELLLTGIEPQPWNRRDVFAVGAMIAFQSANNMSNELLRLSLSSALDPTLFDVFLPDESRTPGFPYVLPAQQLMAAHRFSESLDAYRRHLLPNAALGSSGWAVAAERSATGYPLFAFDSHDALNLPNLFFEVHLFYGEGRSIRGWSLPGLPGVINGFNERLAWGMTNIGDTQDLFLETRHEDDPDRFLLDGEWYAARHETVEIPVKGQDTQRLRITYSANGPLISDDPAIALRWTGHEVAAQGIESLLSMNTARNWEEFEEAIDKHAAPSANITYADMDGDIAFRTIGLLPTRGAGRGLIPISGNDSANAWRGMVANDNLPQAVDPEQAYVAAANARVHNSPPLISADNAPGYRMRRLHDVLAARDDFVLDDMQVLQLDEFNTQAAQLLPRMLDAVSTRSSEAEQRAYTMLRDWSAAPLNSADSAGALIWEHWYPAIARAVFGKHMSNELLTRLLKSSYVTNHALDRLITGPPDSPWWQGRRETLLIETFSGIIHDLAARHGDNPENWRWDDDHTASFRHELHGAIPFLDRWLSRGPHGWGGGHPVLARARYRYDQPFEGRAGATVRVVAEMGEVMTVRAVIPGGQHGHPSSPHYDDQLPLWLAGELQDVSTTPEIPSATTTLLPRRQ